MSGDARSAERGGEPASAGPASEPPGPSSKGAARAASARALLERHWPTVALCALGVPVILVGLGSYSLVNGDEEIYHVIARTMARSGDWLTLRYYEEHRVYDTFMNAPLQYWARGLLILLFGDNMWTVRILTALFGLASVVTTARLAQHVSGRRHVSFLAGLIQLTTLQFVYLHGARTGELEPMLALLYTLITLLFLRGIEQGRSFVGHHVCLALMLNVKSPTILLPLVAEAACFALLPAARAHLRRWLRHVWIVPLGLVWHVVNWVVLWEPFLEVVERMAGEAAAHRSAGILESRLDNLVFYARTIHYGAFPYSLAFPFAVAGMLLARGEPGDAGTARADLDSLRWRVLAIFAGAVLLFYVLVSKHHRWYVLPSYPLLAVLLAAWLDRLRRVTPGLPTLGAVAAVAGWLLTSHVRLDMNPFLFKAWLRPMDVHWREMPLPSPWLGWLAASLACGALLAALRRRWPERIGVLVSAGLTLALLTIGALRVVVPLRHLGHQSEAALLRSEIDALEREGTVLDDPIRPSIPLQWDARYYLGDRYTIVRTGRSSFELHRREQDPP